MDATVQQPAPANQLRELVKLGWHPIDLIACLRRIADGCDNAHRMIAVACRQRADRIERVLHCLGPATIPPRLDPEIEEIIRQNITETPRLPASQRRTWRY